MAAIDFIPSATEALHVARALSLLPTGSDDSFARALGRRMSFLVERCDAPDVEELRKLARALAGERE